MAKRVKTAGMGLVIDLHYSDNWADPAKQCIPFAWQGYAADQMAQAVYDYTRSVLTTLAAAGATPDIVQVGNEIAPGMLIHVCDAKGAPIRTAAVNGSSSTFADLARFLNRGLQAVRDTVPGARTMVHLDRGGDLSTSTWWLDAARANGVTFDVFAESTYVAYQGEPTGWKTVFEGLATRYPQLELAIAEYNNETVTTPTGSTSIQQANEIVRRLPNGAGIGTFFWEPTRSGAWGKGLFTTSGTVRTAIPAAMAIYDAMRLGIEVPAGYHLAWSDEFDVDGAPDPASWSFERGFVRNHEDQRYQPDDARVAGGLLVIEARKEHVPNPDYQAGSSDWKRSRGEAYSLLPFAGLALALRRPRAVRRRAA
jgi:arabinogalactan endo-1,4-beta-galactosidase